MTMHDKMSKDFENNEFFFDVDFDLAKAFDTVNNEIMLHVGLHKLATYGIRGSQLKWFNN